MKIGTGYNSTVQGFIYNERVIENIEGSQTEDEFPKQLFWTEVGVKLGYVLRHWPDGVVVQDIAVAVMSLEFDSWVC